MLSKDIIKKALTITPFDAAGAQQKMSPRPGTSSRSPAKPGQALTGAVLLMFYEKKGRTHLFLIKRQDHLQYHPGQISFPGGRFEKGETFFETALRETEEEAGIKPSRLTFLGKLKPVYISVSDFCVHPFAVWHNGSPCFIPDKGEVAAILEVSLEELMNKHIREEEQRQRKNAVVTIPCFEIGGHQVWGATAMILSELIERLRKILNT